MIRRLKFTILAVVVLSLFTAAATASSLPANSMTELAKVFQGREAILVVVNVDSGEYLEYDGVMAHRRFTPCSTFKIYNTLIGIDSGVITGKDFTIQFDPARDKPQPHWPADWPQDQTLESAFKRSTVWYYRELARRIGAERMNSYIHAIHYGNEDTSGGLDKFWLSSSIQISPEEQARLMRRVVRRELPFQQRAYDILDDIMVARRQEGHTLRAKTGSGPQDGKWNGWYVGWVDTPKGKYAFALLLRGPDYRSISEPRFDLTCAALQSIGLWPAASLPASGTNM